MHVVISRPVHQKEIAFQLLRVIHGAVVVVAALVLLRGTHEALGVDGVVVTPVRHGSHTNPRAVHVRAFGQAEQRHEPAVAPTLNANPSGVHKLPRAEVFRQVNEVLGLELSQFTVRAVFKFAPTELRASRVAGNDNVAFLSEELLPQEGGSAPTVCHGVGPGTAVNGYVNGVFLRGIKILGKHFPAIQFHT